jgi:hypothetical protein
LGGALSWTATGFVVNFTGSEYAAYDSGWGDFSDDLDMDTYRTAEISKILSKSSPVLLGSFSSI